MTLGGDRRRVRLIVRGPARRRFVYADDPSVPPEPGHDSAAEEGRFLGAATSTGMRFHVLRPHAQGGIGKVSVAFDAELQREVALKQIKPERADDADSRARFLLEAEVTGRLEHPGDRAGLRPGRRRPGQAVLRHAVRAGNEPGRGDPAVSSMLTRQATECRARALELRQLLDRFADVCHTVAYAHSRGVLHRDLKPANILLGPFNESLVVDWGLAKVLGRSAATRRAQRRNLRRPCLCKAPSRKETPTTGLSSGALAGQDRKRRAGDAPLGVSSSTDTQAGTAFGTPAFMSPEQADGLVDQLGPASDVYSLGAVLYTLLCGKGPV